MLRRAALLALLLAPLAQAAEPVPDPRILQPRDVFDLEWADNPALSPDGARIVYQRNHYDIMKDRRRSHLWLLDADGSRHRPLTSGQGSDGEATWSPNGDRIAWVSARDGSAQIWVRWMDSGQTAVLSQLTEGPAGLSWSPDGRTLAFTMRVPADTRPLAKLPAKPKGAEWAPDVKVIDTVGYRADGAGYVDPGFNHVFVLPAEGGSPRQVTQGEFQHDGAPIWSRDGQSLYVVTNYDKDWQYAPADSEIYRVDVDTGTHTALTTRDGLDASPDLSPDGKQIAYVGWDDKKLGYHQAHLYILDIASGESRALTDDFDADVSAPRWSGDGRGVYFGYEHHGEGRLAYIAASGGKIEEVAGDFDGTAMGRPYGGGNYSAAGSRVAYTRGTVDRPSDIAVVSRGGKSRVLTDLNRDSLARKRLGAVEELWVKSSADGMDVQGWIVKPPHFVEGRKYPLLLEIHGGPYQNYGPRFAPETQLYASAGYVVLYVNPRGSTSYGQKFADQIQHDYPSKDYDDLMTAVDATIAKGYVDESRLYVTGGSGGGVLTAWIVGHTDRFRAAVVAKPVINWTSFVLTADAYPFFTQYWFAAPPWAEGAQENYWKRSPLAYVGNVKTPTMLITGESDHRTPISETEQYYQALKLLRIDTAMVRIPGASHGINLRPSHMLAQVLNTLGWFERYSGPNATQAPTEAAPAL
jgi:acylaminoacyl-peptidase